jgi:hypothetical protein
MVDIAPASAGCCNRAHAVLDWLVHDWHFLGLTGQVWMPLMAAGLALYIAVLIVARRRRTGLR